MLALEFECERAIALLSRTLDEHDDDVRDRQLRLTVTSLVADAASRSPVPAP